MLEVISALGLLLLMPGPTNTLLLRSGLLSGFRSSSPLVLLECLAYLLQISLWGYLLSHIGDNASWCLKVMQLASVAYLIKTSYKLWRTPDNPHTLMAQEQITPRHFFLLTLINPKGLLVASFIVPVQTFADITLYLHFTLQFCLVVIPVGCIWVLLGACVKGNGRTWLTPMTINRTASVVICCFTVAILSRLAETLINTGAAL